VCGVAVDFSLLCPTQRPLEPHTYFSVTVTRYVSFIFSSTPNNVCTRDKRTEAEKKEKKRDREDARRRRNYVLCLGLNERNYYNNKKRKKNNMKESKQKYLTIHQIDR